MPESIGVHYIKNDEIFESKNLNFPQKYDDFIRDIIQKFALKTKKSNIALQLVTNDGNEGFTLDAIHYPSVLNVKSDCVIPPCVCVFCAPGTFSVSFFISDCANNSVVYAWYLGFTNAYEYTVPISINTSTIVMICSLLFQKILNNCFKSNSSITSHSFFII